jgi:hypothetical protein
VTNLEGVPTPVTNDRVGHLTVDCHWPDRDLVIELDTDQTHGAAWKQREEEWDPEPARTGAAAPPGLTVYTFS